MNAQQGKVLEIDLIELLREIKKHIPQIIITMFLLGVVAYVYKFMYAPPMYTYTRMVVCPTRISFNWNIPDQELLSYVAIFRIDIGNGDLWKEKNKGCLTNVSLVRENSIATKLIQFQFVGTDPAYIKTISQQYMETVAKRLNDTFAEKIEVDFNYRYYDKATKELNILNNQFDKNFVSSEDMANYLPILKRKLEALEKDKTFLKAKIIDASNQEPLRVNNRSFVLKSAFLGLFLSLGYIIFQYIRRLSFAE